MKSSIEECALLRGTNNALEQQLCDLQLEMEKLSTSFEEHRKHSVELSEKNGTLHVQLSVSKRTIDTLQNVINDHLQTISDLREEISNYKEKIDGVNMNEVDFGSSFVTCSTKLLLFLFCVFILKNSNMYGR